MTRSLHSAARERLPRSSFRPDLDGRESDLSVLRELVDKGYEEAERRLTELAVQRGDLAELRRLADEGNEEAEARLTELIDDMK